MIKELEAKNKELNKKYIKLIFDPLCRPYIKKYLELEEKYVKLRQEQLGSTPEMDDINDEMYYIYDEILTVEEVKFVNTYEKGNL